MDINKEQNDKKINIDEPTHAHLHTHEHTHEHEQVHEHTHEHLHEQLDEHLHEHSYEQTAEHTHEHVHQNTKAVINRLSRAIGHLESVKKMVEDGRDCSDVLIQLAAVRSALNNTGKVILKDHIEHCIVKAIEEEDWETIQKMNKAIDQFMK